MAAGVFAGLFGKGGGLVIVPMLIGIFHYDPKKAAATSLAALQLPVGLPSVLIYAGEGHLDIMNAVLIAAGIVIGVFFGFENRSQTALFNLLKKCMLSFYLQ